MTLKEIEKRIAEIRALKGDPDSAWLKEIKLYIDTLKAVVELMPNTRAGKLAAAALQATRITR